jgi:hypothetical protein
MKKYKVNFVKVSKKTQNKMRENILETLTFNKISNEQLELIENKLNIKSNIIASYRNQLLKEKVIKDHHKIINNIKNIIIDYENLDIIELSKKYKFSPMSIIRIIIKNKYPMYKLSLTNLNELNKYDREQVLLAEKNDIVSNLNQDNQQLKSEKYEEKIKHFLDKKNIKYKVQEELVKEQINNKGYVYATPDFLLNEKIVINDYIVNWIEVKNFYGTNINFMTKKIQKQINKYYNIWGTGCLVYRYGVYKNLKLDNCIIIAF